MGEWQRIPDEEREMKRNMDDTDWTDWADLYGFVHEN